MPSIRVSDLHPLLLAWLLTLAAVESRAEDTDVVVNLASGRTRHGRIDARTTEETLWLRTEGRSSSIARPILWTHVISVSAEDQILTKEEILARTDPSPSDEPRPRVSLLREERAPRLLTPIAQPRYLTITTDVANWDEDAEVDGLLLWLAPRGAQGEIIPLDGRVDAECWGLQRREGKPAGELTLIERWSLPICPADFTPSGIALQLPYGAVNPLERLDLEPWGVIKVRVSSPGNRVLAAQLDGIRVKPATPVGDRQRISELIPR